MSTFNSTSDARFVVVVTSRFSYSDGSSVATRFGVADRDNANRVQGLFLSRDDAQAEANSLNSARPTCSNLACPLASTLLDPDAPLCGYCQDRQPGVEVVS